MKRHNEIRQEIATGKTKADAGLLPKAADMKELVSIRILLLQHYACILSRNIFKFLLTLKFFVLYGIINVILAIIKFV